jgi:hypothetical protein
MVVLHVVAWSVHLWSLELTGESLFWVIPSGFGFLFKATSDSKNDGFFRERVIENLKWSAFFEFFLGTEPLGFLGEMALQPVVAIFLIMHISGTRIGVSDSARHVADYLLGGIGLFLVVHTGTALFGQMGSVDWVQQGQVLVLPVWLTVGSIPAVYLLALLAGYETIFLHMRIMNSQERVSLRARLGVVVALRGRLGGIYSFSGLRVREAGMAHDFWGGRAAVHAFRRDTEQREAAERDRLDRLARFSGVEGEDEKGLRLDRREFAETKKALRGLAISQIGWFNRRKRYREDLLAIVAGGDRPDAGLQGAVMRVSKRGGAWYAYRMTPSGWILGIGASRGTPDQWFYDSDREPSGFPAPGNEPFRATVDGCV